MVGGNILQPCVNDFKFKSTVNNHKNMMNVKINSNVILIITTLLFFIIYHYHRMDASSECEESQHFYLSNLTFGFLSRFHYHILHSQVIYGKLEREKKIVIGLGGEEEEEEGKKLMIMMMYTL
ncbi:hypothetical protein T4D_1847 [Trichinella pseudospiralis]|uniref:Transmembrane protein n=1 Tax=Trichinella pseudospiralis TaxID=6337 RepID=A0A0V1FI44_TRIPS|nr:hypothetical protein T4D_1847 [Trichinella pseudospiralis]